jgi:hypothetical protein
MSTAALALRPYQQAEVDDHRAAPKRALFWQPRVGKTLVAVRSLPPGLLRGVVVAPYGVCPIWKRYLADAGYGVIPIYERPNSEALDLLKTAYASDEPVVALTNYQRLPQLAASFGGGKGAPLSDLLAAWKPGALVIDESHMIASPSARWARAVRSLAWSAPWVRCLSGTPAANHYGSLWGQLSALDPDEWGHFYREFRERYLVCDAVWPSQVVGYKNVDELRARLQRVCSIVRRADVFGPDMWEPEVREVELPRKAMHLYRKLAREWLIDDPDARLFVDGSHILTRLLRLQQIASGYVVPESGDETPVHAAKIDAAVADLGEIVASGEKAIVFHRFTWEGTQLLERLSGFGCPVLRINGAVPAAERDAITARVERESGAMVVLVQTQSGGVGISFAEAAYALVLSQSFSFVAEEQARDRIFKPNATRHVMYYRVTGTVDEFIAEALERKLDMHTALIHLDREDMAFGTVSRRRRLSSVS